MNLNIDYYYLTFSLIILTYLFFSKFTHATPYLFFSNVRELKPKAPTWKMRWMHLPYGLDKLAILSFILALINIHAERPLEKDFAMAREGLAVYLVLDRSGSMGEKTDRGVTKIELVKKTAIDFVKKHQKNDLIGIVEFARTAQTVVPLTFDTPFLVKSLENFQQVKDPNQDGTALGYAIFKTANLLTATRHFIQELPHQDQVPFTVKSSVIILITDGFQATHPLDKDNTLRSVGIEEAAEFAKENNIHLYIINVDPLFSSAEFAPHRRLLERSVKKTNGKLYLLQQESLSQILDEINHLERGLLPDQRQIHETKKIYTFPYFIFFGLLCLAISLLLKLSPFRVVP